MGSLLPRKGIRTACGFLALAVCSLGLRVVAADQIVKNDGTVVTGHILSVSDGAATMLSRTSSGGTAQFPVMLSDIKSITMDPPAAVTQVQAPNTPPGQVIAALETPVKQYAGLQAKWVVDAMAQLGDAYSQVGDTSKALEIYNDIGTLYPNSAYTNIANASRAQVDVEGGKYDEALQILNPIVEKANQDLAPSPVDGATYAKAFIVYGRVLEAQKKLPEALDAFLTVKTMFYQNANLAAEADHYASELRKQNPGIGVD